ncbi:MAG: Zn-dependent hydrolase [Thermodesulfobacteriota bacterium]
MNLKNLRVNENRLRTSLEKMAEIGQTPKGGVHRLALSDEDREARNLFVHWLKELDLEIIIDEMGNIFGRRQGEQDHFLAVLIGSHLDTQPQGGRFDGILGVLGALEVMRTLQENKIKTEKPLVIVNWTNEEGSRFSPAMMGSGVWTGKLNRDWVYNRTDIKGKKVGEELVRIGYRGEKEAKSFPVHAYFELHIEQGPILDKEGITIGVPRGIVGIAWADLLVEGKSNQVGPTPMEGRNDALCAAAEMILQVEKLPRDMGGNMVATVGEIHNLPNSRNIIPGQVRFTVDIRSWDDELLRRGKEYLQTQVQKIAERRGCPLHWEDIWMINHTPFAEELVKMVEKTAAELGYSTKEMVSGAGHDASYLSQIAPTAMIFVPSIGGRSHVEVEETKWADCAAGANVLLHCVCQAAGGRAK